VLTNGTATNIFTLDANDPIMSISIANLIAGTYTAYLICDGQITDSKNIIKN
jgi:hypothetical protein